MFKQTKAKEVPFVGLLKKQKEKKSIGLLLLEFCKLSSCLMLIAFSCPGDNELSWLLDDTP